MSEKLEKLEKFISDQVDQKVEERSTELESKFHQQFAIHANTRQSEWEDYKEGNGEAFAVALGAMHRAFENEGHSKNFGRFIEDETYKKRFLGTGTNQGGGNVLPIPLAQDVIPSLYKRLTVMQAGATVMPVSTKNFRIGRQSEKSVATFVGEGAPLVEGGPSFDEVFMDQKKLTALATVSNDFLRSESRVALQYVAADLMKAIAQRMDAAILYNVASATQPAGIYQQLDSDNIFTLAVNGGVATDIDEIQEKLDEMEIQILKANVDPNALSLIMDDQTYVNLRRARDNGHLLFPELRETTPSLIGKRVYRTNNLPTGLDLTGHGDDDERIFYMGDFSSILVGILLQMEIDFSEHEKFSNDQVVVRAVNHFDSKLRRDDEIAALVTDWEYQPA